ncbi:hypothetical protein CPB84DRAFT_282675 [Gymnopilus junonius]|uniref:Uncharacterized protein n=1 Tax=Gymnopilus junonius TaxID=109634 RepID=A0A9P5NE37_GYMJU|nr:hypothetical protein CPB84DRAFT_282675 [Gymnopilus junonius]
MFVGRVLGWTFRLSNSQRSFVTASAMFMNSNALPIALMQSLVLSVPDLAWGDDDNTDAMMGRALTYLTMYSTLGMVIRYSYGISLLSRADTINTSLASAPFPSTSTAPSSGLGPGPAKNISYLQQGEDDEHAPLLGSTSRPSSPLHTHPSSSTLYEPYNEREHDQDPSAASSSKSQFTDSPETIGSTVPLPVLPPHPAAAIVAHSNAHGQLNGLGINGVDVDGSAFAAAGPGPAPTIASPLPLKPQTPQRPQPKRANTHTSFYNSFPNSPNESREDLPEWEESSSSSSGSSSGLSAAGQEHEHEQGEEEEEEECTATTADEAERDLEAAETGLIPPDRRKRRRRGKHHREHHHHPSDPHTQSPRTLKFKHLAHSLRHTSHRLLHTLHALFHALNNFMTVPLWAALASLLVACIEPLKHTLERHLTPLNDAVATCGRCAVPLTLVVLGGYFLRRRVWDRRGGRCGGEEERERRRRRRRRVCGGGSRIPSSAFSRDSASPKPARIGTRIWTGPLKPLQVLQDQESPRRWCFRF